jgi:phage head maturation protease
MPTMHGHFAVFNRWTEINSWFEGNFLERIAPGAFKKTFREKTPKVLFQHGQDPQIGDKPLGPIESLAEDETGAAYEVPDCSTPPTTAS